MAYRVQFIPWRVAKALGPYVRREHGDETVLEKQDLVLGVGKDGLYRLGLVRAGTPPSAISEQAFRAYLDNNGSLLPVAHTPAVIAAVEVIPGQVVRAILAACREQERTGKPPLVEDVSWEKERDVIVVMLSPPALSEEDTAKVGGKTSAGEEIHYHIETSTYRVVRTTWGR